MTPLAATARSLFEPTDAARWQSVLERDPLADGVFVYAVRSTRIFCRPSCPSRRPRRSQVSFFQSPEAARRAGYRACRRCRPETAMSVHPWAARIVDACAYLARSERHVSLRDLARWVGSSPYHLQRTFKRFVGLTPREYGEACRLGRVKQRLRSGQDVTTAMWEAGYGSSGRFYEGAVPRLGMLPTAYRQGGLGMTINYTIVDSSIGRVLVASTDRGVCAVAMAASERELVEHLAEEYPAAVLHERPARLADWTKEILTRLDGRPPEVVLPLDVQATAFQWRVWRALEAIPRGETRTYGEIARAIGRPRAVRAVGRACATNPVTVAIPCHRAVGASGALTGYRWGVRRKKELLERERGRP